jgi:phospholipase/lecithinase/hemolysin
MCKRSWPIVCGAALAWAGAGVAEAGFSGLVLFGDSLSDVGNVYNQTFGISPQSPPYFQGRYSNGPLWDERLATDLNLPAPTPSRLGGRDYAFGGTKTGSGSTFYFPFSFPNIGSQINNYLGGGNTPTPGELFVLWGGGNDFIDGQANPQVPVNNITNHVTALAGAGARQFLVPNLPPLGEVPRFRGTSNQATMNARTAQFNDLLGPALDGLESSLGVQIFQLDVEGLFHEMLTNPSAYGFTNTTGTALVGNTPVPNPDEYVFWDDIHPTRVAHALLGSGAAELVNTHRWVSTQAGGAWHTAGNWDPAGVPQPDWIAHAVNDNLPSAQAVAVGQDSMVAHVLVRGDTGGMTLIVQSAARLGAGSIVVAQQGRISLQGGTINTAALTVAAGGSVGGTGMIAGNLLNDGGVVAPGEPGSTLRVDGSFTQSAAGRLEIDLGGADAGLYDVLEVTGGATLAGALAVRLADGFVALPGQSFLAMTFASRGGDVSIVNETGYAGISFDKTYTATSLTLTADARGGDANLDGTVNLGDFNILAANFGAAGVNWLSADFTGDALVNLEDFNVLAANFGLAARSAPAPSDWAALASVVPEPGTGAVLAPAVTLVALRRRRRRGGSITPVNFCTEFV